MSFSNRYSMLLPAGGKIALVAPAWRATGYSLMWWLKVPNLVASKILYRESNSAGNARLVIGMKPTPPLRLRVTLADDGNDTLLTADSSISLSITAWHSVVWTDNGQGAAKLYVDGVLDGTGWTYTPDTITIDSAQIGGASADTLPGNYDEFAQFGRVLSQPDVTRLHNGGTPTDLSAESDLLCWLRMGDGAGWDGSKWIIPDVSGQANHGTSSGLDATAKSTAAAEAWPTPPDYVGWPLDDNAAGGCIVGADVEGSLVGSANTSDLSSLVGTRRMLHLDGSSQYAQVTVPKVWPSARVELWSKSVSNPVINEVAGVAFGQLAANPAGGWWLFVAAGSEGYRYSSADLLTWTDKTLVLPGGGTDAWDRYIDVVSAFRTPGGSWVMFYRGRNTAGTLKMGKATSPDGTTWTRKDNSGVDDGLVTDFANNYDPVGVILVNGTYYLWVNGDPGHGTQNVYASTDLETWTPADHNPVFGTNSGHFCPGVFKSGDYYYLICPWDKVTAGTDLHDHTMALYRSIDPSFPPDKREFVGHVIVNSSTYDVAYLDTPSVPTADVGRAVDGGEAISCLYTGNASPTDWTQSIATIPANNLAGRKRRLFDFFREEMTYSFWVQFDTLASGMPVFSIANALDDSSPHMLCSVGLSGGKYYLRFYAGGYQVSTAELAVDTLYHVALTHQWIEGAWVDRLYVNGVDTGWTYTPAYSANQANLYLGAGYNSAYLDGYVGDFRMYPRGLTTSQVNRLYRTGRVGRTRVLGSDVL